MKVFLSLNEEHAEEQSVENLGQQMIRDKSPSASPLHAPATENGTATETANTKGFAINAVDIE